MTRLCLQRAVSRTEVVLSRPRDGRVSASLPLPTPFLRDACCPTSSPKNPPVPLPHPIGPRPGPEIFQWGQETRSLQSLCLQSGSWVREEPRKQVPKRLSPLPRARRPGGSERGQRNSEQDSSPELGGQGVTSMPEPGEGEGIGHEWALQGPRPLVAPTGLQAHLPCPLPPPGNSPGSLPHCSIREPEENTGPLRGPQT